MDVLSEVLTVIVGAMVALFLLLVLIFALLSPLLIAGCNTQWSSFEHRWGVVEGCMLKVNGHWIPEAAYREIK